jgi:uncharacterized membrane protein YphA (DoxX/SURF4 family)
MSPIIVKLNKWANAHTNVFMDVLRVLFGGFMFYKGICFLNDSDYLSQVLTGISPEGTYFILIHYVSLVHFCGGLFIMLGLLTRLCSFLQIPILIGAVLINFVGKMDASNLVQASAGLLLSVFFMFYGSGKHSVDYSLQLNM